MGQQQILLIVLSVIIIGITVSVGIAMFHRQAILSHRQEMIAGMNSVLTNAIIYKMMPYPIGGGSGSFIGFLPAGADNYRNHIGSPANSGFRIVTNDVNYFVELWAEGSYPQRVKIIASSKIYGQGNYWVNTYNALITANFDTNGKIINNNTLKGFVVSGDWK